MSSAPPSESHDRFEVLLSDYVDGSLGPDERREIEQHLESCAACKAALAELRETMNALSGMHRVSAPENFDRDVAETIRRRSRGRFFGRKALGDRVPLALVALFALGLGLAMFFFLRGSDTGSFKPFDHDREPPAIHKDAPGVVPRP